MSDMPEYSSIQQMPDYSDPDNNLTSMFDPDNPEIANMEREAYNYIHQAGAPTEIYLRTSDLGAVDDVWEEDNNPIYDSPVPVKGQFVPEKMSTALVKFGVESNAKFDVHYSRAELLDLFGNRLIRSGDVIDIPHNTLVQTQNTEFVDGKFGLATKFRVLEARDTGNFNYRWLYWTCTVELLTGKMNNEITVRSDG